MRDIITQIDVEKINPSLLPSVPVEGRENLPEVSGIYFAISQTGEILYIGKASCIRRRWEAHHRFEEIRPYKNARIAWFTYLAQTDEELATLEKECILHFMPVLNYNPKKTRKSGPRIKLTVYLEPDLNDWIRQQAIIEKRLRGRHVEISDIINEALRKAKNG